MTTTRDGSGAEQSPKIGWDKVSSMELGVTAREVELLKYAVEVHIEAADDNADHDLATEWRNLAAKLIHVGIQAAKKK